MTCRVKETKERKMTHKWSKPNKEYANFYKLERDEIRQIKWNKTKKKK